MASFEASIAEMYASVLAEWLSIEAGKLHEIARSSCKSEHVRIHIACHVRITVTIKILILLPCHRHIALVPWRYLSIYLIATQWLGRGRNMNLLTSSAYVVFGHDDAIVCINYLQNEACHICGCCISSGTICLWKLLLRLKKCQKSLSISHVKSVQ